jgi:uncharacterized DUF497 family protein
VHFEWDAAKSAQNYRDRGFDFGAAALIFAGFTLERPDSRKDYGERRVIAIGTVGVIMLTVVYTDRHDPAGVVRRIISARRSNRHERERYEKARTIR